MVPMQSVTVLLARKGFQHYVVYCLLPPTWVYFAVLQPRLFSVYCPIHCTTTKTPLSELPQALCWSAIVFSVTRAVISLLPNIIWCHSLLAFDILFPGAVTMTKLASSSECSHEWVADNCSCPCRLAHITRKKGDYVWNLCFLCLECRVFGYNRPLSKPGLFLWKKALKHCKEYFCEWVFETG